MEIVIKIDDKLYNRIKYLEPKADTMLDEFMRIIQSGAPLPKHHGRLKDVDWIDENCKNYYSDIDGRWCYAWRDIDEAPTIIEGSESE